VVFGKIMRGLARTRRKLGAGLSRLFAVGRTLDEELLEELEELLYEADLGPTGTEIVESLAAAWKRREITETGEVRPFLRRELLDRLAGCNGTLARADEGPTVILVAGVNGSGKTTSIAKLARRLQGQGHRVMLAAGDTFRAAAVEQLTIWADRIGAPIIRQPTGADPASVAFDAADAALARGIDFLIVDTAGRLHTQKNLMAELEKISRVLGRRIPGAPHESLLVLDATTGQNAIRQAEEFRERVPLTGLLVAKLDGTAKGGAIFGIRRNMDIPVKFIGLGEGVEDLEEFAPEAFIDAVLAGEEEPQEA
jgi:fused signal recognition particle receptor